ncbi:predicted protein [Naegleria gruberi]|uniref:Predicted protein n=1 Tax=Naegleria gruberi TaxID=5762 RepID=D2VNZ0_NAEGR|nr:uncharacterized protein NAEGRDRAFT_70668 [Naegleria gruberi]EFC41504.1 predicted protein [Naegleria gruberi]|eukprot:XP_002674248.1 predicted protein [Naegleria gruberi strain NEG-M]
MLKNQTLGNHNGKQYNFGRELLTTITMMIILVIGLCTLFCAQPSEASEVVAIGDLHGDYSMFLELLNYLNLTRDETSGWINTGDVELIQTGDVLDRGEYGLELVRLFMNNTNNSKVEMLIGKYLLMMYFGQLC